MSASPITGLEPEEHSSRVTGGMALAQSTRERWLRDLVSGSVSFALVVEYSRLDDHHQYLGKLRLIDILRARPGWTRATALDVLQRNGFTDKDNVKSIRRHRDKVDLFGTVLQSSVDRWRARPSPPPGWPWNGKLQLLVESAGAGVPPELGGDVQTAESEYDPLAEMLDDEDVEATSEDALTALLGEEDD